MFFAAKIYTPKGVPLMLKGTIIKNISGKCIVVNTTLFTHTPVYLSFLFAFFSFSYLFFFSFPVFLFFFLLTFSLLFFLLFSYLLPFLFFLLIISFPFFSCSFFLTFLRPTLSA